MANPPGPVFIGLDGYFILIFLQKSGYIINDNNCQYQCLYFFNNWQSVKIPFSLLIIFLLIQRFLSFTWLLKKEVNYLAFVLRVIGQNVLIKKFH